MTSPIRQSSDLILVTQNFTLAGTILGALQDSDIVMVFAHANFTLNGSSFTVVDSQGQTVATDVNLIRSGSIALVSVRVHKANVGDHTLTVTYSSGNATDSYYGGAIFEVPGIVRFGTGTQGTGQGNTTTGPVSATTGTLDQAIEWLLAFAYNENNRTGFAIPATGGWAPVASIVTSSNLYKFAEQVTGATTPVTANFGTLGTAGSWDIVVLPYLLSNPLAGSATESTSAQAALTTAIQASGVGALVTSAQGGLTNWATVTLANPLYTGQGGVLDPHFWVEGPPPVGTTLFYDNTYATIYANGEVSSTSNNCSFVIQWVDTNGDRHIGVMILTPGFVTYANVLTAIVDTLSTAIVVAGAAISATQVNGDLTTGVRLLTNAVVISQATSQLITGVQLAGLATEATTMTGALSGGQASLQGRAQVLSSMISDLVTRVQAVGQVIVNSQVVGGLTAQIALNGSAAAFTNAVGPLSTAILLSGQADVATSGAGTSLQVTELSGTANLVTNALASLLTGFQLAGRALAATSAQGDLSTGTLLSGLAEVDTAAAIKLPGAEVQFGRVSIQMLDPSGFPVAEPTYIAGSAAIATISYYNSKGLPFVPATVTYAILDMATGFAISPPTTIENLAISNSITIEGSQNTLVSRSRTFEEHQLLFAITDGLGRVNYAAQPFEVVQNLGLPH